MICKAFALTKWLRRNTLGRITSGSDAPHENYSVLTDKGVWKDRQEAEIAIGSYLSYYPCLCFKPFVYDRHVTFGV